MKHIISIHNKNNEEAWKEILKWEAMHAKYVSYLTSASSGLKMFVYLVVCVLVHVCSVSEAELKISPLEQG
jgi:hypothetical protein